MCLFVFVRSVARGCEGSSGRLQTSPHRECWRCRRRDQQQQPQRRPRQPPQLLEPQETLQAGRRGPRNDKRRAETAAALSLPPTPGPGAPGPKLRPPPLIRTPTRIRPVHTSTLLLLLLSPRDWRQCIPAIPKWGTLHRLTLRGEGSVCASEWTGPLLPCSPYLVSFAKKNMRFSLGLINKCKYYHVGRIKMISYNVADYSPYHRDTSSIYNMIYIYDKTLKKNYSNPTSFVIGYVSGYFMNHLFNTTIKCTRELFHSFVWFVLLQFYFLIRNRYNN